ncbi:hypothetical protein TAMA11512_10280 [Selenomonas sp. TAMA-11512]|uniref:hypothetical protein n=1 Tax=Selenomonas sp. TAMA-11512 TaxID=3095337 RepID=UPI00308905FC|nr:hypothetical protein TAMA11512_10280 [Selenomonas sp. TAMA-11512]
MMSELFGVPGILLIAYLASVFIYVAVEGKRRGRISAAAKGAFAIVLPIAGLLLLLLYELLGRTLMKRTGPEEEDEDLSLSFGEHAYSADIVPLRDVFLMDDPKLKRKFFTDAIKQDVVERQAILNEAVHDSDREIAYYAVSMMTAHMERLSEEIYALEEAIKRGVKDDVLLDKYVEKVREFLLRRYGDAVTREQQRKRYMEMLRLLAERHPDHSAYHAERIRALIRAERFEEAEAACTAFRESRPSEELPLLLTLQLQQVTYEREKMKETIAAMKQLPTRLTNEAMQAIRYWDGGGARE